MNKSTIQIKTKLNWAIDIPSKSQNITKCKTLKMTYHSLFGSYLHYGAQLWGQTNTEKQKQMEILQNRAVRKITFKKCFDSAGSLYKELNVLKFCDIVDLQNCLFMSQTAHNGKLVKTFPTLKQSGDNHSYNTR